jgi:uncharacterized protein (DUF849 family)
MKTKCIINCAVTGSIHIPSLTPHLPITPQQIAGEAIAAVEAGAATVHLHARDPQTGQPTMDLDLFGEFCREISHKSEGIICLTTGGAPTMTPEERMVAVRKFQPELASINMGSINFGLFPMKARVTEYKHEWEEPFLDASRDFVFKNTFHDQERILGIMQESGTKPELECYDVGHLYNAALWADQGIIKPPFWIQLILGITGAIQPSASNLLFMKETADKLFGDDYVFSVLAAGRHQFTLGTMGAIMGGCVRVGMEDNIYLAKGVLAKSNADMVGKIKGILDSLDIATASVQEARQILGLKGKNHTHY